MAKFKRSLSAVLSVIMAASALTFAPVSAASVDASNSGANTVIAEQAAENGESSGLISDCSCRLSVGSYIYDGTAKKPNVYVYDGDTRLKKGTDYNLSYQNNVNPGTASAIVTGKGAYTGSQSLDFYISEKEKDFTECSVTLLQDSFEYDGSYHEPEIIVKDGSRQLVYNTDYSTSCSDCVNAGTAAITVKGRGMYSGKISKTYEITKRSVENVTVTAEDVVYNGQRKHPQTVVVRDGDRVLSGGEEYSLYYANDTDAGTAQITVIGMGNYTGKGFGTYKILPKDLADCQIDVNCINNYYGTTNDDFDLGLSINDTKLTENVDYTIDYAGFNAVYHSRYLCFKPEIITLTINGIGNYTGKANISYKVLPKDITSSNVEVSEINLVLKGSKVRNTVKITDTIRNNPHTLTCGIDYSVEYIDKPDNTVDIVITGLCGYTGTTTINTAQIDENDAKNAFVWGRDNWSFNNEAENFQNGYKTFDSVLDPLSELFHLTSTEKSQVRNYTIQYNGDYYRERVWHGSCYGMALSSLFASQGYLDLGEYTNSSNINEVVADENSTSVINFFQAGSTKIAAFIRKDKRKLPSYYFVGNENLVQPDYIQTFEREFATDKTPLLLVYGMEDKEDSSFSYHAVVAYGVEPYDYTITVNGTEKHYDRRILIYDPNGGAKNAVTDKHCIYYDSSDYSWVCPIWTNHIHNCYWDASMGTETTTGSLSSITKVHSLSCVENMLTHVKFDSLHFVNKGGESVGAGNDCTYEDQELRWVSRDDEEPDETLLGDADCDGYVSILDATVIQRKLVNLPVNQFNEVAADIDGNGLDITDATWLRLHTADYEVPYPIGEYFSECV